MAYGKIKADALIYDDSGDQEISLSSIADKASLASPTFTGTPAAPTAAQGTNTTQLATTAFVSTETTSKAPLADPTFTGVPEAPTAGSGTNTTQIATTAFVTAAVPDISGKANTSDIGVTIQGYDADTAKTDIAQTFTAAQRGTITALTDGATITPDFATSNFFSVVLGGNRTIADPTNITAGQGGAIFIVQDATGSRTAAWGSVWDFAGGTAPTLTTDADAVDRVDYVVRSATSIHAVYTGNYS